MRRLLLSIFVMGSLCFSLADGAEPNLLVHLPWGTAEEALGLIDMPEVEKVGPTSFTLDHAGNLYVCDFVNRCVKKYDAEGNFVGIVASDVEANHVAVSRRGVVYVRLDDGHIAVFHQGKRNRGIRVDSRVPLIEGYEQGIALVDDYDAPASEGWLAVSDPAQSQHLVARVAPEAGALLSVAADEVRVMPGKPQPDGIRYRPRWQERQQGLLQRFTSDGTELAPILISTEDTLGSITFKGKDSEGNLYIENERIAPDQYVHLEIRVYSPQGELLQTLELPNNYYTTVYRKTWLRPDGAILQMLTQPDGVSFTYWQ